MARRDLLWVILLVGLGVRLVRIGIPMLEVAPTRQAQTAVIARKPLLFLYTRQMAELYRDTHVIPMEDFAGYLGAPLIDVDSVRRAAQIALHPVDPIRYNDYKYDFLTHPATENQFNRDILLREFAGR